MKHSLCFIGSTGQFSLTALQTLLTQQVNIRQIILAAYAPAASNHKNLPVSSPEVSSKLPTIPSLAALHNIPVFYAGNDINNFSNWEDFPHSTPPEFLFVACFPFRLPTALRQWPTQSAINLHPSLLPRYRGPDPLFWQLRHDERNTGFSLHVLTDALDAGPVLTKKPIHFPQGASRKELDTLLAQQGTEAFCALLSAPMLKQTEQESSSASYHPPPQADDFTLDLRWSAARAYNFICGTNSPIDGYPIMLDGQWHHIETALGFESSHSLEKEFHLLDNEILIQFSPGVLHAKPV